MSNEAKCQDIRAEKSIKISEKSAFFVEKSSVVDSAVADCKCLWRALPLVIY
jgi:hypothetical protein